MNTFVKTFNSLLQGLTLKTPVHHETCTSHGGAQHLQRQSSKAGAQAIQEIIHDFLDEREQVVDDDLEGLQKVAKSACQWVEDAERGGQTKISDEGAGDAIDVCQKSGKSGFQAVLTAAELGGLAGWKRLGGGYGSFNRIHELCDVSFDGSYGGALVAAARRVADGCESRFDGGEWGGDCRIEIRDDARGISLALRNGRAEQWRRSGEDTSEGGGGESQEDCELHVNGDVLVI